MPYLGKSPQHGNYSKLDDFSGDFDGSDATHAVASNGVAITPVRPEALIISINGVIQEPVTDYTVSGTNITFTTAPTSGDNFFGVAMGEQLQIGTPSDATVTSAKLSGDLTLPGKLTAAGDTAAGDNASIGYTGTEGLILTGQGSTNDVTIKNDADADVITIATGATNVDVVGDITAATLNADGDTSAGDNAAIGYTAGEGLILTGQGSTNDITVKNDADAAVISVPTGTTNVTIAGDLTVSGTAKGFGWIFLERVTASSNSTIEFNDIDNTYDRYMFALEDLIPATDGGQNLNIRISTDNGSTFISSSTYSLLRQRLGVTANLDETDQATMYSSYQAFGGQASEGCAGTVYLYSPANSARNPLIQGHVFGLTATDGLSSTEFIGMHQTAAAVDAIQFYFNSGDFVDGGHITMYGLSKS